MYERNGRGSTPLFGAIEENGVGPVPGLKRIKQRVNEVPFRKEIAMVLDIGQCGRWNLVQWAAGMSTGCAQEMQKDSCRWPALSRR